MNPLVYVVIFLSMANLTRMAAYLVISDWYTVRQAHARRGQVTKKGRGKKKASRTPMVSVVVPAHNEEVSIRRTLGSLRNLNYPADKLEVIVVNDGSYDSTERLARECIAMEPRSSTQAYFARLPRGGALTRRYVRTGPEKQFRMLLVSQPNRGKAAALNRGITQYARGELIMCLDADSQVDREAVKNAVQYFKDPQVVALASNVNIIENGTLLGLTQRFEYILAHQMKKAQTMLNVDYIIGGVGSTFRRSMLKRVNYYDTNTMTEDIDLSMKIIANGNKKQKIMFASDVIMYTEAVANLSSLIRQRYRWRYGRWQTFLKNSQLFFTRGSRYSHLLTWFILPFALWQEFLLLLEPAVVSYILWNSIHFHSLSTFFITMVVIGCYSALNLWGSNHLSVRERLRLTYYAPATYCLIYLISIAEYLALMKGLLRLRGLRSSLAGQHITWKSPERTGAVA